MKTKNRIYKWLKSIWRKKEQETTLAELEIVEDKYHNSITDFPFWKAMNKRNHNKEISIEYFEVNGNGPDNNGFNTGGPPRLLKIISTKNKKVI